MLRNARIVAFWDAFKAYGGMVGLLRRHVLADLGGGAAVRRYVSAACDPCA